jgi:hypothetical protein
MGEMVRVNIYHLHQTFPNLPYGYKPIKNRVSWNYHDICVTTMANWQRCKTIM